MHIRNTGNSCHMRDIQGDVNIGNVGHNLVLEGVAGNITAGQVGSDANLQSIYGTVNLGHTGADLYVQADFPPGSSTRFHAGSDACIVLPENANLTIHATAGGAIRGKGAVSQTGNHVMLRYGDGSAQLDVAVGGDLEIRSNSEPNSSSSSSSSSSAWWNDFMQDMSDFEYSMGQMGQNIEAEIAASMSGMASAFGTEAARKMQRNAEKQRREMERQRRKAEEQARRFGEKMARMNVRIHNREWRMDPERINHIIEQANRAAAEGIYGAMEAVEQALRNISIVPPEPPKPPTPPKAPASPPSPIAPGSTQGQAQQAASGQASTERAQPEVPVAPAGEQAPEEQAATPVNKEQEREAILRMIAEGRITPDEGDMLLEALDS
ncbi:MAG: hypothetical protein NVS4B9_36690 [Ktedonobacteraceae bacterium]